MKPIADREKGSQNPSFAGYRRRTRKYLTRVMMKRADTPKRLNLLPKTLKTPKQSCFFLFFGRCCNLYAKQG
jgi:hypothetical protein